VTGAQHSIPQEARGRLRAAMAHHELGDVDGALAEARLALELAPAFAEARSYLGSTLVTRLGRYAEGLAELERAREAAPADATINYTLGWCYEFVAHRVTRRPKARLDSRELYEKAIASLRRCLELRPEDKLRDDARDLLSSIIREDVG
jgi:tetratricopeptide (TPR) repeat protein